MEQKLGVIGGMGKETSDAFIKRLGILDPNIKLIYTIADDHGLDHSKEQAYIESGEHFADFEKVVTNAANFLWRNGASHIVLICNTAHQHEPAVRDLLKDSNVQFLSIIDAAKSEVVKHKLSKVLLFGTSSTTFRLGLYDSLKNILKPSFEEQQSIDSIILKLLRNEVSDSDIQKLVDISLSHDTDGILFACTDLANLMDKFQVKLQQIGESKLVLESTKALENFVLCSLVES